MTISFSKYQGTGNDFVLIDDRTETFPTHDQALITHLCHRRFGIGADGLILLQNGPSDSTPDEASPGVESHRSDFRMVYFNADGAEGSMCGNGGRCIVRFAHDLGLFESKTRFVAVDGEHLAEVQADQVYLKMSDVQSIEDRAGLTFLNTGSPHVVRFVDELNNPAVLNIVTDGQLIRRDARFAPGGTNVNFAQVLGDNSVYVRTYERGVEDETYSCGTGVTAVALAAHEQLRMTSPIAIQTLGGNLRVSFTSLDHGAFTDIYLIGPAKRVFTGAIDA